MHKGRKQVTARQLLSGNYSIVSAKSKDLKGFLPSYLYQRVRAQDLSEVREGTKFK